MTAFGQTSLFQTENHSDNARKVLIEEHSYPHTVTCISTYDGDASFVYSTPASTATQEVAVTNCYVNDMVIFGDTLFFCGINTALGKAVIGFFNIRDLFIYGTGNILVKENFVAGENLYQVNKLTRIESYLDDMLVRHVVAVGECDNSKPCLVELAESFPGAWTYNAGYIKDTLETLTDIKVVGPIEDRHLVSAGYDRDGIKGISLRAYDINDPFSVSGIQDNKLVYRDSLSMRQWLDETVLLTDVDWTCFATLSHREMYNGHPNDVNVSMCFFKRTLVVSGITSSMASMTEFSIPVHNSDREINQFEMGTRSLDLLFLHSYKNIATGERRSDFCEVPYSNPASVGPNTVNRHAGSLLQGMTLFNSGISYRLSGFTSASSNIIEYWLKTILHTSVCTDRDEYYNTGFKALDGRKIHSKFSVISGFCNFTDKDYELDRHELNVECSDDSQGEEDGK